MRTIMSVLILAFVLSLGAGAQQSALEADSSGWEDIMPPADLNGWIRVPWTGVEGIGPEIQWKVADGQLVCAGDKGHEWLVMDRPLGDYILHVEWRFTPRGADETRYNSGIGVRLSHYGEIWHQAQTTLTGGYLLGDTVVDGGIQRVMLRQQMTENRVKPAGEWNVYEIRSQGDTLSLWVNGAVVSEWKGLVIRKGYVGLEAEGYEITFRNLKLKELR